MHAIQVIQCNLIKKFVKVFLIIPMSLDESSLTQLSFSTKSQLLNANKRNEYMLFRNEDFEANLTTLKDNYGNNQHFF